MRRTLSQRLSLPTRCAELHNRQSPKADRYSTRTSRDGAFNASAPISRVILVLTLFGLVHATPGNWLLPFLGTHKVQAAPKEKPVLPQPRGPVLLSNKTLPGPVLDMRDLIFAAIATGDIEELRLALEWNELRPDLGIDRKTDAIEHFKAISIDGQGLETLAALADLLSTHPTRLQIGKDLENNDIFVWPGLAESNLKTLSPAQQVQLFRIMPTDEAAKIIKTGEWTWYRIAIGADGTWHVFKKER